MAGANMQMESKSHGTGGEVVTVLAALIRLEADVARQIRQSGGGNDGPNGPINYLRWLHQQIGSICLRLEREAATASATAALEAQRAGRAADALQIGDEVEILAPDRDDQKPIRAIVRAYDDDGTRRRWQVYHTANGALLDHWLPATMLRRVGPATPRAPVGFAPDGAGANPRGTFPRVRRD